MLRDLVCKFASRRKNESEQWRWLIEECLEDWKGKGSGLSGTCVCETDEVATGQGEWDGLLLDGRWSFVAEVFAGVA